MKPILAHGLLNYFLLFLIKILFLINFKLSYNRRKSNFNLVVRLIQCPIEGVNKNECNRLCTMYVGRNV
jgi:hypothetical protein